jgi:hypothetical protein
MVRRRGRHLCRSGPRRPSTTMIALDAPEEDVDGRPVTYTTDFGTLGH